MKRSKAKKLVYRRDDAPPSRPKSVEVILDTLIFIEVRTGAIIRHLEEAIQRHQHGWPPAWRGEFQWGDVPPECDDPDERKRIIAERASQQPGAAHRTLTLLRDHLYYTISDWRAAIDTARGLLSSVAAYTNRRRDPAVTWWTARLRRCLSFLGGAINRFTVGDIPPIEPMIVQSLSKGQDRLARFVDDLKGIGPEAIGRPRKASKVGERHSRQGPKFLRAPGTPRATVAEANERMMELLRKDEELASLGAREWAKAIPCSLGLIPKLPMWKTINGWRRDSAGPSRPTAVSLTGELEANLDDRGKAGRAISTHPREQDALQKLTEEQDEDFEPSPLEPDHPGEPRQVRGGKRV